MSTPNGAAVGTRVYDTELRMMIQALEATEPRARSIDQKWKLSALQELAQRRAQDASSAQEGAKP